MLRKWFVTLAETFHLLLSEDLRNQSPSDDAAQPVTLTAAQYLSASCLLAKPVIPSISL